MILGKNRTWRSLAGFAPDDDCAPAAVVLGISLYLLPLLCDSLSHLHIDFDRAAPLVLLPAALACSRMKSRPVGFSEKIDAGLLGLILIIAALACSASLYPAPAFTSASAWVWIVAGAWIAGRIASSPAAIRIVMTGITAGAVLGILRVQAHSISEIDTSFPYYGHPRIFGLHMLAGSMASLALLVVSPARSLGGRVLTFIAAGIVWSGLLWSGSRGPLVGIAAGGMLWMACGSAQERKRLVFWGTALVGFGLGGSLLMGAGGALGWWTAFDRTVASANPEELSSGRIALWLRSWQVIQDSPWWGHGFDAYRGIRPRLDGDQPHNMLIQWLLEFGFLGTIALIVLVGRRILRGLGLGAKEPNHPMDASIPWKRATAASLLAAVVCGFFDGVFYHAIIFIPVAVWAGFCGAVAPPAPASRPKGRSFHTVALGLLTISTLVLMLHGWIFYHLVGPVPASPNDPVARALRVFPSSTVGLWRWLDSWRPGDPDSALDWALWAQPRSFMPSFFYGYAADRYLERGDLASTEQQLTLAVATAHKSARPHFEYLLKITRDVRNGLPPPPIPLDRTPPASRDNIRPR